MPQGGDIPNRGGGEGAIGNDILLSGYPCALPCTSRCKDWLKNYPESVR